jgi:hypothetical protein
MTTWLDMFRDTITCSTCKGHFTVLLENYRKQFPNMLESRHEFVIFTFRAHNAVNRRINKPIQGSVEECVSTLRNVVRTRTARDYRISYINHITRYWRTYQDIVGITALRKIQEIKRIETEYLASRDTNFTINIRPDVVVLPQSSLEQPTTEVQRTRPVFLGNANASAGFRLTPNGFRLRM